MQFTLNQVAYSYTNYERYTLKCIINYIFLILNSVTVFQVQKARRYTCKCLPTHSVVQLMNWIPGIAWVLKCFEWDGIFTFSKLHFQVLHLSHFLYLEWSELHWMTREAFPSTSFSFSIPGNKWTALNDIGSISRHILASHFLYLELSELHWITWEALPGISFSFSIPGNKWTNWMT